MNEGSMVAAAWVTPGLARALMVLCHTEDLARETRGAQITPLQSASKR